MPKSLGPRLIQTALCTLAERENQLLIVPPLCPAPSLTHVHRHTTLQRHTLFSVHVHADAHTPHTQTHTLPCSLWELCHSADWPLSSPPPSFFSTLSSSLFILPSPHFLSRVTRCSAASRLLPLSPPFTPHPDQLCFLITSRYASGYILRILRPCISYELLKNGKESSSCLLLLTVRCTNPVEVINMRQMKALKDDENLRSLKSNDQQENC